MHNDLKNHNYLYSLTPASNPAIFSAVMFSLTYCFLKKNLLCFSLVIGLTAVSWAKFSVSCCFSKNLNTKNSNVTHSFLKPGCCGSAPPHATCSISTTPVYHRAVHEDAWPGAECEHAAHRCLPVSHRVSRGRLQGPKVTRCRKEPFT